MGRIKYLIGESVDERQRLLADKISSRKSCSILHLVPTKGRVMELETDPQFWLKKRENTLTGIIYQIFEENIRHKRFKDYRIIDDSLRHLLVKKAIEKRMKQPEGLVYFDRLLGDHDQNADFPGIYGAVAGFFSKLVRNNYQDIFAHDLAGRMIKMDEISPDGGEGQYALESDLVWLFGDYEEIKREIRGYDNDDVISSVRDFLKDGGNPSALADRDVIVFDGFIYISRIEEDILYYMFSLTNEVWWLIDYDARSEDPIREFKESSGREEARAWKDEGPGRDPATGSKEAYRIFTPLVSLMDRLEDAGIEYSVEAAEDEAFVNPVASGLYRNGQIGETESDSLKVKSFGDGGEEVRAIASEIKRIVHEDNLDESCDLGKIRVIFPDLNDYSSLIFEIFREYGLSFSLTKGLPLFLHPLSDIFINIFKISTNRFDREDIFNLFSSHLIHGSLSQELTVDGEILEGLVEYLLPGDSNSELEKLFVKDQEEAFIGRFDIFLFDRVARRCGINNLGIDLSGLKRKSLLFVRDFFKTEFSTLLDSRERAYLRSEYYGFLVQAAILYQRLRAFQGLAEQNNPQEIKNRFLNILKELGLPENIVKVPDHGNRLKPSAVSAMIKRDLKAYSILTDLISSSASELLISDELFQIGTKHDLLAAFYSVFRHRLNNTYLLDERNPNIIRVSQWLETRGRSFDYIFAGGLTADRFPLKEEVNFILSEYRGKILRSQDAVDLSKHLFSHLLRNYRKRLYLSYPRYREEKRLQASQILMDLEWMVKPLAPSRAESGVLESFFKWEENPYFTSGNEMLNATVKKDTSHAGIDQTPLQLKHVILTKESSLEGLIRGINALFSRWALDGLFEYDGMVTGAARFDEFLEQRNDIFSASQLEAMANCPMRYLFVYIYGLGRMEELGNEASPLNMGEYLHSILSLFFKGLRDKGKNVSDIGLSQSFYEALKVARAYSMSSHFLRRLEFFEAQEMEVLAGLEQDGEGLKENSGVKEGVFAKLLRFEEKAFQERIPEGIEYDFGYKGDLPQLGKVRLKGYVDRFDRDKDYKGRVYIYDYKSGSIPSSNMVKKGLSFQLPVYIRALSSVPGVKEVSAAFYSLKKDVFFIKDTPLSQTITDHALGVKGLDLSGVSLIDEYADRLADNLEKGYFHHSADGIQCDYCEFIYACHKDFRRMDHLLDSCIDHRIYSGLKNLETWNRVDQFRKDWKNILKSMQKAFELKSESGRKKHFETVLNFGREIADNRDSLPFHDKYIDELLDEINNFKKRYQGNKEEKAFSPAI